MTQEREPRPEFNPDFLARVRSFHDREQDAWRREIAAGRVTEAQARGLADAGFIADAVVDEAFTPQSEGDHGA